MKVYEYTVLMDDIVLGTGEMHASSETALEKRLQAEVMTKYPHATNWSFKHLLCDCGNGDNDVTAYYIKDRRVVKCYECRVKN